MRTYITSEGERFTVRTARDLLRQMRTRSMMRCKSQALWMEELRRRVYQETHKRLDISSEAAIVAGLLEAGLLKEEGGQP